MLSQHPGRIRRLTGDLHDRSSSIPEEAEEGEEEDYDNVDGDDVENTDVQSDEEGYVLVMDKTDDVFPVFHYGRFHSAS